MTDSSYFLGIDQGSSGTKGLLLTGSGEVLNSRSLTVSYSRREGREIEQDPLELRSSCEVILDWAIREVGKGNLTGIGFALQRSGVLAWENGSGKIHHPLISWEDTRTQEKLLAIGERKSVITKRTTLPVSGHYAGGKISFLQEKFPDKRISVGTLDTYLLSQFCAEKPFRTEHTMASRTMLYDLASGYWSDELCNLLSVRKERLPEIVPSISQFGKWQGIPIIASLGDQQASLFARRPHKGECTLNLGTIASLSVNTEDECRCEAGYVSNVFFSRDNQRKFLIESLTNAAGPVIRQASQINAEIRELEQIDSYVKEAEESAAILFWPFGGTASPEWRTDLLTLAVGWRNASGEQKVRALIENVGSFVIFNYLRLREAGILASSKRLSTSGGLTKVEALLQYMADVIDIEIEHFDTPEATAFGAALAARSFFEENEIMKERVVKKIISPRRDSSARQRYEQWSALKRRSLTGNLQEWDEVLEEPL
jgi:glycerol kinase